MCETNLELVGKMEAAFYSYKIKRPPRKSKCINSSFRTGIPIDTCGVAKVFQCFCREDFLAVPTTH